MLLLGSDGLRDTRRTTGRLIAFLPHTCTSLSGFSHNMICNREKYPKQEISGAFRLKLIYFSAVHCQWSTKDAVRIHEMGGRGYSLTSYNSDFIPWWVAHNNMCF